MNRQTMKTLNMLAFGTSIGTLAVAATYALLRRCCGVELPAAVTGRVLPVLAGAAVGYLTNWLAIQLLFRPYRPVKWLGGLQGLIPKRQPDLADTLAEEIPANLIPSDRIIFQIRRKIREAMRDPELAERLLAMATASVRDERRMRELKRRIAGILDSAGTTGLEWWLAPSGPTVIPACVAQTFTFACV